MDYQVEFASSAAKELAKLVKKIQPKDSKRIRDKIESLKSDPRPHGVEKLTNAEGLLRVREGDYRIIYKVDDDVLTVLIIRIGNRSEVYKRY